MRNAGNERIVVTTTAESTDVTFALGEFKVTVRAPTAGPALAGEEQVRLAALRSARRILEVALQELAVAGV